MKFLKVAVSHQGLDPRPLNHYSLGPRTLEHQGLLRLGQDRINASQSYLNTTMDVSTRVDRIS
jgi:hypothetical protein